MPVSTSRGSDRELAYASPVIKTDDGEEKRIRRCRGSSDDEGLPTWDGYINEDLRVGGPRLCSLPASFVEIRRDHLLSCGLNAHNRHVYDEIHRILQSLNINACVNFNGRQSDWNPEPEPIITALIFVKRKQRRSVWLTACRQIREYLTANGLEEVSVEIADTHAVKRLRAFSVLPTDPITHVWDDVRDRIVRSLDLTDVLMVGCYRHGISKNVLENDPTILILVNTRSTRDWRGPRDKIVEILAEYDLSMVAVEFSKDVIRRATFAPRDVERRTLHNPARPDDNLGMQLEPTRSATFGGYVELMSSDNVRFNFGLTCFHCVMPTEESTPPSLSQKCNNWKEHGIRLDDQEAERYLKIHRPGLADMDNKAEELHDDTRRMKSGRFLNMPLAKMSRAMKDSRSSMEREIDENEAFLDEIRKYKASGSYQMGHVAAASGLRTSQAPSTHDPQGQVRMNMDWALIQVDERHQGTNETERGLWLTNPWLDTFERMVSGTIYVGKYKGTYHALRTSFITDVVVDGRPVKVETIEHTTLTNYDRSFTNPMNPGGFVRTFDSIAIGMVFACCEGRGITFFTPFDDLAKDIMFMTGAKEVRMADE
ncbi:hypothetical protein BO70DRAFT_394351 [Aspergillus heteromorphus CBS 117.55]|uniref:Uncharacterized protein n=1 Tax=Aspergillus heteromorphus CBS 117.55 TaxID=1448321 RepID=A0A317WT94_9EURO|nr:uncharacterized protein BO70DRAFT_394351 [Aspergillus heteromorphus CBS 117.55]PWY87460.1 hypothetical protein BO70DRAFT_394351 [Aspergillus heteromorphus CBS 117.55]